VVWGVWCGVCGVWWVVCGVWCVVCGVWCVVCVCVCVCVVCGVCVWCVCGVCGVVWCVITRLVVNFNAEIPVGVVKAARVTSAFTHAYEFVKIITGTRCVF
jgi:hypothetical protein